MGIIWSWILLGDFLLECFVTNKSTINRFDINDSSAIYLLFFFVFLHVVIHNRYK